MIKTEVSLITINYNQEEYTLQCLEALSKQTFTNFEVILVDNASENKEYLKDASKYKFVKIIENKANTGFTGGNNKGVSESQGKYIVFLNNDTIVDKDWLKNLLKVKKEHPIIGIVASSGVYSTQELKMFKTITLVGYLIDLKTNIFDDKFKEIFFASGCSLIYERKILKLPFDEDYFLYYEDLYLSWLMRLKGFRVKIAPNSNLKHFGCITTNKFVGPKTSFYGEKNRILTLLILYEKSTLIKLIPYFIFSLIIHNLYDPKGIKYRIESYKWLLFNINEIVKKREQIKKIRKVKDKYIVKYMSYKIHGMNERQIKNGLFKSILSFLNKIAYFYCYVMNIKTLEFFDKDC